MKRASPAPDREYSTREGTSAKFFRDRRPSSVYSDNFFDRVESSTSLSLKAISCSRISEYLLLDPDSPRTRISGMVQMRPSNRTTLNSGAKHKLLLFLLSFIYHTTEATSLRSSEKINPTLSSLHLREVYGMAKCKCEKGQHRDSMTREEKIKHLEDCMTDIVHKLDCVKQELAELGR